MGRDVICRLHPGASVSGLIVRIYPDDDVTLLGVGWRAVRLTPYIEGSTRAGRAYARIHASGALEFSKPLTHTIYAAAPGDFVIPDEPDDWFPR